MQLESHIKKWIPLILFSIKMQNSFRLSTSQLLKVLGCVQRINMYFNLNKKKEKRTGPCLPQLCSYTRGIAAGNFPSTLSHAGAFGVSQFFSLEFHSFHNLLPLQEKTKQNKVCVGRILLSPFFLKEESRKWDKNVSKSCHISPPLPPSCSFSLLQK